MESETQGRPETEKGIDPDRLETCLSVLAELDDLPVDHPDVAAVRRATAGLYKSVKQRRRQDRRAAVSANDKAVTEATATGAPGRIDDETAGAFGLTSPTQDAPTAGTLLRARSCYT